MSEKAILSTAPLETAREEAPKGAGKRGKNFVKGKLFFMLICLVPTFLLYIIFMIVPVFQMFGLSLIQWDGLLGEKTFVGFKYYGEMFRSSVFKHDFLNTLFYIFVTSIFTIVLSLFFAAVLSKSKIKGKPFFRILFYVPNILSIVVIGGIFNQIYAPANGLLNALLKAIGLENLTNSWLSNSKTVNNSIAVAMIWQAIGYYMVMYIAGMDSIPSSLYESADLEGANGFVKFFKITLPLTWEIVRVTLTFFIISTINMAFLFVTAMTQGGPNGASNMLLNMMYGQANSGSYGYSMAIGTFLFLFSFILSLIVQKLTNREVIEY